MEADGERRKWRELECEEWDRVETEEGGSGYGEVLFKQVGIVMSVGEFEGPQFVGGELRRGTMAEGCGVSGWRWAKESLNRIDLEPTERRHTDGRNVRHGRGAIRLRYEFPSWNCRSRAGRLRVIRLAMANNLASVCSVMGIPSLELCTDSSRHSSI
jgi:hypothetical protein